MGMLELVVIILGIIVAGGFLLYFFGDLIMGLSNKGKRDTQIISKKQVAQAKKLEERLNALENAEELKKNPAIATVLLNGGMIEDYNPEEEETEAKVEEVNFEEEETQAEEVETEEQVEEIEEKAEEVEETAEEDSTEEDDIADYIAKRRQELMEKLARIREEETEESDDLNLDETEEEETQTEETETQEEEIEEEKVDETEEVEETEEIAPVEVEQPSQVEETQPTVVVKTLLGDLTELEEKLANAQERLKVNEKELRRCKKEYIPLRKVKKTLEKDENKLRRKEALVAKQKVMLYGVNNYADIDEEKAKKLAEDLDLLDGLKLSVQHCHEVMDNNKERYPLLEQIYTLLVNKNNDLKNEIKQLQEAIEKVKNEQ